MSATISARKGESACAISPSQPAKAASETIVAAPIAPIPTGFTS